MKPSIDGKVVIITGAARGIGARTAQQFTDHNAIVCVGDIDTPERYLDVTDTASWRRFVADVLDTHGRIDILVNNAGVMPLGAFETEDEHTTDLVLDVNVRGVINGMRAVLPAMRHAGTGHIVNVASMAGMIPIPGMVSYNASKFAALGASLAARREYAGTGITISAVLPSAVRTELASGVRLGAGLPTVEPDDVARAILRTVRTRAARTSVPRWVGPLWALTDAVFPESVQRAVRDRIDDRRALHSVDSAGRAGYIQRLQRQSADHAAARS